MYADGRSRLSGRTWFSVVAILSALTFQTQSSRADQCDDALKRYNASSPEFNAALGASVSGLFADSAAARQKGECDRSKSNEKMVRILLNNAKNLEKACGARVTVKCNTACWQQMLSDNEQKTAYECSPAALEEAVKAEQDEKARQDQENENDRKVMNACSSIAASVSSARMFNAPRDADYPNWVKICNASPTTCKMVVDLLKDQKEKVPSELTCKG